MATQYSDARTRTHWAGADASMDIHIEMYTGEIEASFNYNSIFQSNGLTNLKNVEGKSNTWRGDREGAAKVKYRKSGDSVEAERQVNDKVLVSVDTMSYIRTNMDYMDEWTSPERRGVLSKEHGIAHAKVYDENHLRMLIRAGEWKAPTDLKNSGNFYDGLKITMTGFAAAMALNTQEGFEEAARLLEQAHKQARRIFIERDMGEYANEFVTLIKPEWFDVLTEHKKLLNIDFQGGQGGVGNNFAMRSIARMNGFPLTEFTRFPTAVDNSAMNPDMNVTAAMLKCGMIFFLPSKTLATVQAHDMEVRLWDHKVDMENILDSMRMYNVGLIRGDCCIPIYSD